MVSRLVVYLDGRRCGSVEQTPSGNITFRYDEEYRSASKQTPLSLSMPLAALTHKKREILPFLQGLLPDNEHALAAIARRYSVSSRSPFALLAHVGSDVAGAVQIVAPDQGASDAVERRGKNRSVDVLEIGVMLRQVLLEYAEGIPYYGSVGNFSLAGRNRRSPSTRTSTARGQYPKMRPRQLTY